FGRGVAVAATLMVAGALATYVVGPSATPKAVRHVSAVTRSGGERHGGNENIELIKHQDQAVAQKAAPFDSTAPGAYAAAVSQRNKAPKILGSWQPIGSTPLHADSPDYAGTDPLFGAGPS